MHGSDIYRVRKELLGLNQEDFGSLLGVHWVTVSRWESSKQPQQPTDYQAKLIESFGRAAETRKAEQRKAANDELKTMLKAGLAIAAVAFLLKVVFD